MIIKASWNSFMIMLKQLEKLKTLSYLYLAKYLKIKNKNDERLLEKMYIFENESIWIFCLVILSCIVRWSIYS